MRVASLPELEAAERKQAEAARAEAMSGMPIAPDVQQDLVSA
jgi:hypothetical protein